jgi:DNA-binding transcriptional MerR regulator
MFTRQEAIKLSGLNSAKLSYLDSTGIVVPQKLGLKRHPTCLYSWEQLIELRTIKKLREDASLQKLRQAKEYLRDIGDTDSLASKTLISANNRIYLIKNQPGEIEKLVIELSGKNKGQVIIHSIMQIASVIDDLWQAAKSENIEDFAQRAKDKPTQQLIAVA